MDHDGAPGGGALLELAALRMPFGRYEGRPLVDLPEDYLLWFRERGFPGGKLGALMALALEIKVNGLEALVEDALGSAGALRSAHERRRPKPPR